MAPALTVHMFYVYYPGRARPSRAPFACVDPYAHALGMLHANPRADRVLWGPYAGR